MQSPEIPAGNTGAGLDPATRARQALRLGRMRMGAVSHLVVWLLLMLCSAFGMLPWWTSACYVGATALMQLVFHRIFRLHLNLGFRDPSMTFWQVFAPIPVGLWAAYFVTGDALRPVIPMLAAIPAIYAILALGTRQLMRLAGAFLVCYLLLQLAIWQRDPEAFDMAHEAIVLLAFVVLMVQLAVIGGFISRLRRKLHQRNAELRGAMERLNQANAELEVLAERDPLTGVYNRRRLFERLEEEVERSRRGHSPLSVCMLDVDHFKEVNDRHGHQAGDQVLRQVATTIAASLRSIDSLGRYGGEEFVLVLPQTPRDGARKKAERVRGAIDLSCACGRALTVSIGVAGYRPGDSVDTLLARADAALYRAKAKGRNRVVLEPEGASAG
ncbi:GGDEF domain-containing protein [Lysobacter sp. GX 14042]|uniref:GGDEF domain-containing protein n=1 Tax=Lysobacter sp. GX 14042 TaxID=2907155 RepID=UPI001F37C79B|nr:GGDEF domain-containing protein [Lysobacter sp. GX 14042]MCE7031572.1 GGDEF domain-containing protein [Lysobacter sp. GX 14042]